MALNLEAYSPKELQALIASAESQMHAARSHQIQDVKQKIEALLDKSGLTLADVYPTRGGKSTKKSAVAPKYQNPEDHAQTWSGRGKRPLWFTAALKRRGVTAETLLIAGASEAVKPAKKIKPAKKAAKKATRKTARKASAKKAAKR